MRPRSIVRASSQGSRQQRPAVSLCVGAVILLALVVSITSLALAASTTFPDVPATHPYYAAIQDLGGRGIIGGYTNGDFGPDDPVTRQQFAKMIVLTGGYPVSESDVCSFTACGISWLRNTFLSVSSASTPRQFCSSLGLSS